MNAEQWEELNSACVIVGESLAKAAEAAARAMAIVALNLSDILADVYDYYEVDPRAELLEAIERIKASADLVDYADELDDIIPAKKLPRPPKRIDPINKANYSHNRPQRQARSSCRVYRR